MKEILRQHGMTGPGYVFGGPPCSKQAARIIKYKEFLKREKQDSSGGPVIKNPPANVREHGFNPWSRKIPHAEEQLSLCNHNYRSSYAQNQCFAMREATAPGESPHTATSTQHSQNKQVFLKRERERQTEPDSKTR